MNNYIKFLEEHLGMIQYGWNKDADGRNLPFQVVKYEKGPFPGTVTYSTLGLNLHYLKDARSEKRIRHELFLVAEGNFGDKNIPGILQQVGLEALNSHLAYLRGQVIGPRGKLFTDSELEALYVSMPVYFPDSFHIFHDNGDIPIVQAWLIPITSNEAKFVMERGWSKFEDILEEIDPDLIDFKRTSII
jgi:hypothetical protein